MPYKKAIPLVFIFTLAILHCFSQNFPFTKEIHFAKYLQDKGQLLEANAVLYNIDTATLSPAQKDSLNYEKGWLAYTQKKLDTCILYLQRVSYNDTRYVKSTFFSAYCDAYSKKYTVSDSILSSLILTDSLQIELRQFQLAGVALLNRNSKLYNIYKTSFTFKSYVLKEEELKMNNYCKAIFSMPNKSPFIAGVLSALLPGAGKWYAGKKKQAIGSFLPILCSGLLTLEAYNRGGLKDARFGIYGSVFSIFYIGNIWGSVLSVAIQRQELNKSYENKILFNMHIPLRNYFN